MLLEALRLKQGQLSDYQFAAKLGISHQLWQMTRTGKRGIGVVVLKAVAKAYPELNRAVLIFLHGDVVSPTTADRNATEKPQNGKIRALRAWVKGLYPRIRYFIAKQLLKPKSER